jgi:hypothetical protein
MCHDIIPEEEILYRRELLAILGFMLTRMKCPYFEDHHVVPVRPSLAARQYQGSEANLSIEVVR